MLSIDVLYGNSSEAPASDGFSLYAANPLPPSSQTGRAFRNHLGPTNLRQFIPRKRSFFYRNIVFFYRNIGFFYRNIEFFYKNIEFFYRNNEFFIKILSFSIKILSFSIEIMSFFIKKTNIFSVFDLKIVGKLLSCLASASFET